MGRVSTYKRQNLHLIRLLPTKVPLAVIVLHEPSVASVSTASGKSLVTFRVRVVGFSRQEAGQRPLRRESNHGRFNSTGYRPADTSAAVG